MTKQTDKKPESQKPSFSGRSSALAAIGIFLLVSSIYILSSPGRIDIIDGQIRYEVTTNIVKYGRPVMRDPALAGMGAQGNYDEMYSYYSSAASLSPLPLVWLGNAITGNQETERFLFSLTSPIFGGLCATILFLFYLQLGVPGKKAVCWTLVASFTTLIWPVSTSVFDNAQHAFFVLLAAYLAYSSAVRNSVRMAVLGGLAAGVLLNYQEYFVILFPALAIITLAPEDGLADATARQEINDSNWIIRKTKNLIALIRGLIKTFLQNDRARLRFLSFAAGTIPGLLFYLAYNYIRFGSAFSSNKMPSRVMPLMFGNPFLGILGLMASPGKSIFLYSPPIILGLLGIRYLWRIAPALCLAAVVGSVTLLAFLSNILFYGGDWCWGPRYLVVVLPLWALAFPFLPVGKIYRGLTIALVALGLAVQLMALSVDNQRFFMERNLPPHFWAEQPGFYFTNSALFARPAELMSLRNGLPDSARQFNPSPYPESVTYCIFGLPLNHGMTRAVWTRQYQVFYLPRPWPLWMQRIEKSRLPINPDVWIVVLLLIGATGMLCVYFGSGRTPVPETVNASGNKPIESLAP